MKAFFRRLAVVLLTLALLGGVGYGVYYSASARLAEAQVVTVRGAISADKEAFFRDRRVARALRRQGLALELTVAGSREMATRLDLSGYDFAFPGGVTEAEKIRSGAKDARAYGIFSSPLVIGSWDTVAQILVANELAQDRGGYYTLDVAAYLKLVSEGKRWQDLSPNSGYATNKPVLIGSSDIRKDNTAALYLAAASYVANDANIVAGQSELDKVMPLMETLFVRQGFMEASAQGTFEDYLMGGMGKAPLVMIYESQFIARRVADNGGSRPGMTLIYPEPTVLGKHVVVALTPNGERVAQALQADQELRRLAVEYGFRNAEVTYFSEFLAKEGLVVPEPLVDVVALPSSEILESMILRIETRLTNR